MAGVLRIIKIYIYENNLNILSNCTPPGKVKALGIFKYFLKVQSSIYSIEIMQILPVNNKGIF